MLGQGCVCCLRFADLRQEIRSWGPVGRLAGMCDHRARRPRTGRAQGRRPLRLALWSVLFLPPATPAKAGERGEGVTTTTPPSSPNEAQGEKGGCKGVGDEV